MRMQFIPAGLTSSAAFAVLYICRTYAADAAHTLFLLHRILGILDHQSPFALQPNT